MAKKKVVLPILIAVLLLAFVIILIALKLNNKNETLITPLEVNSKSEFVFYTNQPDVLYADKEKAIFYLNRNVYTYSFTELKVIDAYTISWNPTGNPGETVPVNFSDITGKYIYSKMMTFPDMKFKGAMRYNTETKKVEKTTEEENKVAFNTDRFLISYDDPVIKEIELVSHIARINENEYVYVIAYIDNTPGTITYVNGDKKTTYNIFENN